MADRIERKITSFEVDRYSGDGKVGFDDGCFVQLNGFMARRDPFYSMAVLEGAGVDMKGRVDVFQYGQKVGEVPSFWTPLIARSASMLYDYRDGDLELKDGAWHAAHGIGAGDLDMLVGFVRKPER